MIQRKDFPTREAFLAAVEGPSAARGKPLPPARTVHIKPPDLRPMYPCVYRGVEMDLVGCSDCAAKQHMSYACEVHQRCVITATPTNAKIKRCAACMERRVPPDHLPFESFNMKYEGQHGLIVGRGETDFAWSSLKDFPGPIFAVNDAALHVEKFTDSEHVFMFAQDTRVAAIIPRLRCTSMIPAGGHYGFHVARMELPPTSKLVWYTKSDPGRKRLLLESRDSLAMSRRLYRSAISPKPTTCLAIHFAWFCGVSRLTLVGCNAKGTKYNSEMENASASPETQNEQKYRGAKMADEEVLTMLDIPYDRA